ncbi:MAG: glycosyltransferase family 2 protein [Actinobacteria bacterium]|nr:glycosyltransferase family 2 protein [Actinomycetota bacterium]
MKVVLPMAGRGSRFSKEGVVTPKPLIKVHGKPMIWWALQSLIGITYSKLIVVALLEHEKKYGIRDIFSKMGYHDVEYVFLNDVTEGQLCTVLTARHLINDEGDILITSSDTYVISNLGKDIVRKPDRCYGIISVANMPGEQWSFARTDYGDKVIEVAEKIRISDNASTGLYYFSNGVKFLEVADDLIAEGCKTKGEYYVIPVYQRFIDRGWNVHISKAKEMWDLGTPENLDYFEKMTSGGC